MNKNIEREYKVLVNKDQFERLLTKYPTMEFIKQVNTYYDTEDLQIQKMHGAMRIREKCNSYLFTMKLQSEEGLLEFECEVKENSCQVFQTTEILDLLKNYQIQGPFIKLTKLTTYRAVYETNEAELCFDYSIYNGQEDYEIEYEYKKDHDGQTIFSQILNDIGVTYQRNCTSKIKRALDSTQ